MSPRPRGRPRSEPSEVQRRRILDAARAEFTRQGYDATTVAGIAVLAKVPRAVVYETIGDKESLLSAIADEVADELVGDLAERFGAEASVGQALADLVHEDVIWFMDRIRRDPSVLAIVRLGGTPSDPVARARQRIEDQLTQLHRARASALGVERTESARLLAVVVLSLVEGVAFRAPLEAAWPGDAAAQLVAEFVTGGYVRVEAGPGRPAEAFDAAASVGGDGRVDS
jgi:AcrR family transcriptional regulator